MINQLIKLFSRNNVFARTYKELATLSDRELNDLGVSRNQVSTQTTRTSIRGIANLSAAY